VRLPNRRRNRCRFLGVRFYVGDRVEVAASGRMAYRPSAIWFTGEGRLRPRGTLLRAGRPKVVPAQNHYRVLLLLLLLNKRSLL